MDFFFFQAEDGIRDLVRSRGLGDVYKRQGHGWSLEHLRLEEGDEQVDKQGEGDDGHDDIHGCLRVCLLYTSDAADERSSVDLGGRRIIEKKNTKKTQHNNPTTNSAQLSNTRTTYNASSRRTAQSTDEPRPLKAV